MAESLSAVVVARDAAGSLPSCLSALRRALGSLAEVVVVDRGSRDATAATAAHWECDVIAAGRVGEAVARNIGARRAGGDMVAFVDADVVVAPGWSAALKAGVLDGAGLVAGPVAPLDDAPRSCRGPATSDAGGDNGFLAYATAANLAVRSDVFEDLDGFDDAVVGQEAADLCFRAQLRGHTLSFVPGAAAVAIGPRSVGRGLVGTAAWWRSRALLDWRYQRYPFHGAALRTPAATGGIAKVALDSAVGAFLASDPSTSGIRAMFDATIASAARAVGSAAGQVDLISGWRSAPPILQPQGARETATATELPARPAFVLTGPPSLADALALRLATDVAVAPAGLAAEALEHWDDRPPWALALARRAADAGWDVPVEIVARRLERERPKTWGDAFVVMHAVYAWLRAKRDYGIYEPGAVGGELALRLGDVPELALGPTHPSRRSFVEFVRRGRATTELVRRAVDRSSSVREAVVPAAAATR